MHSRRLCALLVPLFAIYVSGTHSGDECLTSELAAAVLEGCQQPGTAALHSAVVRALSVCHQETNAGGLRIVLPDIFAKPWLQPTLAAFSSLHGVLLDIDVWPAVRLHEALVAEAVTGGGCITAGGCIADGSNSTAGAPAALLLHTVGSTHDLASGGILADLSDLVTTFNPDEIQWPGISQLFRLQLSTYMGSIVNVPLDGGSGYMLSRTDVLTHMGISEPPQSWTELLDFIAFYRAFSAAQQGSATAGSADGGTKGAAGGIPELPPYPLCLPVGVACKHLFNLNVVWTTIAQTHGVEQGVHFNASNDLEPLIDSPAAAEAFRVMAALLAAAAPPEPDEACTHGALGFARGKCALVVAGMVPQLKYFTDPDVRATVRQSDIRLSRLPGSELVWQRGGGSGAAGDGGSRGLVPCSTGLCPYGSVVTCGTPYCNRTRLINFAPAALLWTLTAGINSKAPFLAQLLAFEALSYLASPDRYGPDEPASPVTSVAPVRDQFTDLSGSNANIYTRAGYEPSLMDGGLAMARVGSRHHPNRAWPLRMAGSTLYNNVIQDLMSDVRAGGITLSGLPASASPYYKAAAAAAEGWGSAGSVGAAPASGWMQSSSWAASLLVSGSGGSSGSDDDHVSTDYAGYADDDSAGGGVPDTISLEAALDAARNTLAAHYLPKDYLAKYLTSLGRSHLSIDDTGAAPGAAGDAGDSSGLMIIISVSLASVFFVMVAALLLVYQLRRNRCSALQMCGKGCKHPDSSFCGRRTSFVLGAGGGGNSPGGFFEGAASKSSVQMAKYAPEPHQPAVIAVTDIESSTQLWEDLPAEVMAAAMHLHHAAVRRLLLRHEGYESATEGDSFIAVFRSAHRAVMFGADLQNELVRQPWPQQLLEHPVCKPVHTLLPELYPFLRKKDAPMMSPSPTTAAAAPPPPQTQLGRQQSGAGGGVPPSSASQQQGLQQAALAARPALRSGGVDGASGGARGSAPSAAADMAAVGLMTSSLCYDDDFVTTAGAAQLATEVATWCDTTLTDMAAVAASHHGGGSNGGMQQSGRQQQQQQQQQQPQHSGSFKLVSRSSYCPGLASDSQQRLGRQCAPASPQLLQPSQQQSQQAAAADGSRGAGGSSAEANAALVGLRSYLAPPRAAVQPQLLHHPQCASAPPTLLQRNGAAAAAAALGSAAAYSRAGRAVATAAADADEHSFTMDGGGSPDESSVAYAWFLASNGAAPPAAALETGLAAAAYSPTAAARPYAGGVGAAEAASRAAAEGASEAVGQQQPERSSLRRQHLASRLVRFFRRDPAASASALAAAAAAASAAGPSSMRTAPHGQAPHDQPAPAAGVTPEGLAGSGAAAYALARRNPSHLHSFLRSSTTSSLGGGSNPYAMPRGSGAASQQLAAAAGTSDDDLFEVSLALAPVAEVAPSSTDGVAREHPAATAGGVTAAAAAGGALWRTAASRGLSTQDSHGTEPAACAAQQPLSPAVGLFISEAVGGFDEEDEIDDNQTMAFLATGAEGTPQSLGSCPAAGASSLYDSSRRRASGGPATSVAVAEAPSSGSRQQHYAQQQPFAAPAVVAAQRLSEYFSAHREADLRHQQQGGVPMPPPPLAAAGSALKRPTSLVFRGLRVRVGMWAVPSLSPAELRHNAAAARLVVGGPCLAAAKALADMAHGGQVLLAGATEGALQQELRYLKLKSAAGSGGIALLRLGTYSDLSKHQAAAAAAKSAVLPTPEETALADLSLNVALERSQMQLQRLRLRSVHDRPAAEATAALDALVARAQLLRPQSRPQTRLQQEALLDGGAAADAAAGQRRGATDVLCVVPAALSARLVHTPPLRVPATLGRISQVYDAPTASTSYLVVQVPKAAALLAWDVEVASESLRLLRDTAHQLLMAAPVRGYLVPSREDQIHVAFPAAAAVAALGFAEALRLALLEAPWPQALLEHELGEMVEVSACSIAPRMATQAPLVQASEAAAAVAAVSFADAAMLLHSPRPRGSPPPTLAPASAALPRLAVRKTPTTRPAAAPATGYGAGASGSASGWSLLRFFPASAGGAAAGADKADSDGPSLGAVSLPTTPAAATARRLIAAAASAFTTSRKVARWHSAANHRCGSSPAPVPQQPPVGVCQTAAGMLQHMTDASSQQHPLHARPMHMQHRAPIDVPGRMRLAYGSVASAGGMGETASPAALAGANSDRLPVALAAERAELVLEEPRLAFTPLLLTAGLGLPDNGGIMQQPQNLATTGASEWPEPWNSVGVLLGSSPPGVQVLSESNSLLAAAKSPSRAGGVVGFDLGRGCESTSSGGMTWQQQLQGFAGSAAVEPVLGTVPLADLASNGSGNNGIAASCANDFGLNPARVAVVYSPTLGSAADPNQPASKQTTAEQWTLPAAAAASAAERSAAAAGVVRSAGGCLGASNSDSVPQMQGNSHHGGWSSSVAAAAAGGWPSATTTATPPVSHCGGEGTKRRLQGHQSHVHLQPQQLQTMLLRGLRIRMGLATGAAEWRISRSAQALVYTGAAVVSATKLASSAACGQLLCDRATHMQAAAAARDEGALPPPPSLTWAAPAGLAPAVAAALFNPQPALLFSPLERWAGAPLKARKALSGAQLCSFVSTSALPSAPNVRPLVEASGPAGLHSAPSGTDALRAPVLLSAFRPSETNLHSGSPAALGGALLAAYPAASPARTQQQLCDELTLGIPAPPDRMFARARSSSLASPPANGSSSCGHGAARRQPRAQLQSQEFRRMHSQLAGPAHVPELNAVVAAVAAAAAGPYGGTSEGFGSATSIQAAGHITTPATPRQRIQIICSTSSAEVRQLRAPPPVAAAEVEVELQQQHQQQQQQTRSAASLPSPLPHSMRRQSRLRLLTTACGTVHATDVSGSRPQQASAGQHPAASSTASNTASNTATGMASNTATLVTSTTSQSARPGLLSGNQSRTSSDLGQSTSRGEVEAPALASASDHRPPPPFAVVMPASGAAVSSAGQISSACVPPNLASSGMFMSANAPTTASNYWGGMSMNARLASLPEVPERGASACHHDESCPASFVTDAAGIDRVAAGPAAAAPSELTTQSSSCQPQPGGSPRADVTIGGSPGTEPPPLLQRDSPAQQPAPVRNSSFDRTLPIRVFRALLRSSTSGPEEYAPASGGAAADTAAAAVVHPTRAGATLTNTTVAASGASVTRRLVSSQESFVGAAAGVAQPQPAAGSSLASPRLRRLSSARYQGGFDLLLSSAHSAASGMRRGGADTSGDVADMLRTHTGGGEADSRSCSSSLHAQVAVGASNGGAAPSLRMPSFLRSSLPHPRVLLREGSYASPLGTLGGRGSLHALAGASTSLEVEAETAAAAAAVAAGAAGAGVRGDAAAAPHGDAAAATGAGAGIDKQEDPYEQRHPQQQQQQRHPQQQQQQAMHEHAGLWSPFDASAVPCSPFLSEPPAAGESVVTRMKESSLAFWAAARSAGNAAGAGGAAPRLTSGMRAAGSLLLLPLRSSSHQSERPADAELPRAASRQA